MMGGGSPFAWQFSMAVAPASITVSTGSMVMTGGPGRERVFQVMAHGCIFSVILNTNDTEYQNENENNILSEFTLTEIIIVDLPLSK